MSVSILSDGVGKVRPAADDDFEFIIYLVSKILRKFYVAWSFTVYSE